MGNHIYTIGREFGSGGKEIGVALANRLGVKCYDKELLKEASKESGYCAEIFENHLPFIRPCHVILEYGAPILPRELTKEEKKFLGSYTQNRIQEMLDKNKSLI